MGPFQMVCLINIDKRRYRYSRIGICIGYMNRKIKYHVSVDADVHRIVTFFQFIGIYDNRFQKQFRLIIILSTPYQRRHAGVIGVLVRTPRLEFELVPQFVHK